MYAPPAFIEEEISTETGSIVLKVFLDKDLRHLHVFAIQAGTLRDYSSNLKSAIKSLAKFKKLNVICYLASNTNLDILTGQLNRKLTILLGLTNNNPIN
ncbi:hypothetical protein NEHOM01_1448 [Nematocida homosporus]|uniref:uncharacterized protein n=1 Tax=Nematocida homosporus TaxID=1912981 RepID=UPI00221FD238|nr:uncharacterized protein NEHOM01_1448 [Nematocida homosporus]KAI5186415.1 hypothetical protein NEHOM01_1448 [Nematocida homosporus]